MSYSLLVSELTIKTTPYEQGLEFADTLGKAYVRTPLTRVLQLDTKSLDAQLKQAEAMLTQRLKAITIPVELKMSLNGANVVIEQSGAAKTAIQAQDKAIKELGASLGALDKKGYGAFAGTLRGAADAEKALERAKTKLAEIGNVKAPGSSWSQAKGAFNVDTTKIKEAEADLKTIGAQLQQDSKFTTDFNAHLQKMQGLIDGAAAKGEKLGTQIGNRLKAAASEDAPHQGAGWREQIAGVAAGIGAYNALYGAVNLVNQALKEGIGYNARLEQTLTGFQTQLGGSAEKARAFYDELTRLNDKSPFQEQDILPSAQKFLAAKMGIADIEKGLRGVNEQTAALGGNGEKFGQISTALGQIYLKPRLQLEEITRQLIEAGVPAFDLLSKAYHTNSEQIQEWISKGLIPGKEAFRALANQMERTNFGAAEKQSRTLAGAYSTLSDRTLRGLGLSLSDTTGWLTKLLNKLVYVSGDKRFQEWVSRVGRSVAQGFGFVYEILKSATLASFDFGKAFVDNETDVLNFWVGAWRQSAGFVWDVLKGNARNLAWFADTSTSLIQGAFGGGDFFQNTLNKMIGGVEGLASTGTQQITAFTSNFKQAMNELYGLKGLDLSKLWNDAGKYADGLLKTSGKPPAEYHPKLGPPKNAGDDVAKGLDKAAAAYDKMAKAAEDSGKRQLDALKGVRDTLKDIFGSIQDDLAKYGVFNSPLDGFMARIEKLANIGPRAAAIARQKLAESLAFGEDARIARSDAQIKRNQASAGNLTTGSGAMATRANGELVMPASTAGRGAVSIMESIARSFDGAQTFSACALVAGKMLNAIGVHIKPNNRAADLRQNAVAMGAREISMSQAKVGDLINWRGSNYGASGSGNHVGVYEGGGYYSGNGGGAGKNPARVHEKVYDLAHAHFYNTSDFANGKTTLPVAERVPGFLKNAMGMGNAATLGAGAGDAGAIVSQMFELLQNLKLSKLSPLPKEWGAPIKEGADTAARFKVQMLLADTATQQLLRAGTSESGFKSIVAQLRAATNEADAMIGRLRAAKVISDEIRALDAKTRARGKEGDPFAALDERRRPGGDLAFVQELNGVQRANMARQAAHLEAVVKTNTLAKGIQGPVLPVDKLGEMQGRAEDLRRTLGAALDFGTLQTQALHDALDSHTFAIRQNVKAIQERKLALEAGAKFVTASIFNEAGYARAVELRGKEIEFWNTNEVKGLARHASALEALAKANTLPKGVQGPINSTVNVAGTLAAARTIRRSLNADASWAAKSAASGYDYEKARGRTIDMASAREEMNKRLAALQMQIPLIQSLAGRQTALNDALESQTFFLEKLDHLKGLEHSEGRARQLATELTARQNLARAIERSNAMLRETATVQAELAATATHNTKIAAIYNGTQFGSNDQTRELRLEDALAPLHKQAKEGAFDFFNGWKQYAAQIKAATEGVDSQMKSEAFVDSATKLGQLQNDLAARRLELERPLSELRKQQLEWDTKGAALTQGEADKRAQILDTLRQIDGIQVGAWMKEQSRKLQLSGTFDSGKRADLQFQFDKEGNFSDEQIAQMLPFDRILRRQEEFNERAQSLLDDWKGTFEGAFRDVAKGEFSFSKFLDNISNRLIQWGADTLSSAAFKGIEGLLGNFATGILGGGKTALPIGALSFGDAAKVVDGARATGGPVWKDKTYLVGEKGPELFTASAHGNISTAAQTQSMMMQMAREVTTYGARQMAASSGSGDTYVTNTITHTGDIKADSPTEYRKKMQAETQPTSGVSRRTEGKFIRQKAGGLQ